MQAGFFPKDLVTGAGSAIGNSILRLFGIHAKFVGKRPLNKNRRKEYEEGMTGKEPRGRDYNEETISEQ